MVASEMHACGKLYGAACRGWWFEILSTYSTHFATKVLESWASLVICAIPAFVIESGLTAPVWFAASGWDRLAGWELLQVPQRWHGCSAENSWANRPMGRVPGTQAWILVCRWLMLSDNPCCTRRSLAAFNKLLRARAPSPSHCLCLGPWLICHLLSPRRGCMDGPGHLSITPPCPACRAFGHMSGWTFFSQCQCASDRRQRTKTSRGLDH